MTLCLTCNEYQDTSGKCCCISAQPSGMIRLSGKDLFGDDLGPVFIASGITHCRDGTVEFRDAKCELIFTFPNEGGIIFSDEFIAALRKRLDETEMEKTE